ncbi:MAG: hypothetical protein ACYTFD_11400, partial [Planctomycetota bacterium]
MNPAGSTTARRRFVTEALAPDVPMAAPARAPEPTRLWWRAILIAWVLLGFFLLDRLCLLLM